MVLIPPSQRNVSHGSRPSIPGYQAPDKIDSKFFDPKYAFKDVEVPTKSVSELVSKKKPKVRAWRDTNGPEDVVVNEIVQENEGFCDGKCWKSRFGGGLEP